MTSLSSWRISWTGRSSQRKEKKQEGLYWHKFTGRSNILKIELNQRITCRSSRVSCRITATTATCFTRNSKIKTCLTSWRKRSRKSLKMTKLRKRQWLKLWKFSSSQSSMKTRSITFYWTIMSTFCKKGVRRERANNFLTSWHSLSPTTQPSWLLRVINSSQLSRKIMLQTISKLSSTEMCLYLMIWIRKRRIESS